jgi:hypothetical protein
MKVNELYNCIGKEKITSSYWEDVFRTSNLYGKTFTR